ncbi:hypothetical protein ACFFIF_02265 [Vagococcus entomophilus]|uniref:Uncharacterized protein n=1 Tax=Vagococcus entomophilus TaxID=1160095 RepID=A0A430AKE3_9ENTE|nr:hypothetical protein [Vagococcus entomophilus]RSU08377.1 hypothetical protein CBF30_03825 [Vagococcus entomophilus]
MKKYNWFTLFSYTFLAFVIFLLLLLLTILGAMDKTLLSEHFMENQAQKSLYYKGLAEEITREIQDLGLGSNFPEEVFEECIAQEQTKKEFNQYIVAVYHGRKNKLDKEFFEKNLTQRIESYMKKNQLAPEQLKESSKQQFIEQSYKRYASYIELDILREFGQRASQFQHYFKFFYSIVGVSLMVVILLLYLILGKWIHRLLRYLSYSFIATGLFCVLTAISILYTAFYKKVAILSPSLYRFLTSYIETILLNLGYLGVVILFLGLVFATISEAKRKKKISHSYSFR